MNNVEILFGFIEIALIKNVFDLTVCEGILTSIYFSNNQ